MCRLLQNVVVAFDELLSTDLCNDDAALPLKSVQPTGSVIHVINPLASALLCQSKYVLLVQLVLLFTNGIIDAE